MCISRTIIKKKPNTLISPSEATNSYTATKDMNPRKHISVTNYDRGCFKRKLSVHSNTYVHDCQDRLRTISRMTKNREDQSWNAIT